MLPDPAASFPPSAPPPGPGRWAAACGAALLFAYALAAGVHWLSPGQQRGGEEIVERRVPDAPASPRELPTAPDPGDNP